MASPPETQSGTGPSRPVNSEGQTTAPPPSATATATAAESAPSSAPQPDNDNDVNPVDFDGAVDTNHDLPTPETIRQIDNYAVLDRHGKSHTFRSLYTGPHAARRVLLIFVRHFYCGNCQEYLRTLSESITPAALLALPIPTSIAVIGCGDPALIEMYAAATGCPFPIYADPTRRLYGALGMVRTLALGERPAYMRTHLLASSLRSVAQGLRQIPAGLALKGGDSKQVGGEFLFEPVVDGGGAAVTTPPSDVPRAAFATGSAPSAGEEAPAGTEDPQQKQQQQRQQPQQPDTGRPSAGTSLDGKGGPAEGEGEDKAVTWCHRMKTTRDHAEIPELMEVLGLDGHGRPVGDRARWERALRERKGTGTTLAPQIRKMAAEAAAQAGATPAAA